MDEHTQFLKTYALKGCRKCHGRGYTAFRQVAPKVSEPVPCECVKRGFWGWKILMMETMVKLGLWHWTNEKEFSDAVNAARAGYSSADYFKTL